MRLFVSSIADVYRGKLFETNEHVLGRFYVDMYTHLFIKLNDRPPDAEHR